MQHPHLQDHIDLIARHEQQFHEDRTPLERVGDGVAAFAGSLSFVALHLLLFAVWFLLNTLQSTRAWHFDPYPFGMLDTVVAIEAILLASFILMRQSRLSKRSDQRDHLMLQILLLTEKETTKLLEMNLLVAEKLGIKSVGHDQELEAMVRDTPIDEVADTIRESLPPD
ncbi:MAG: DUF1003 domain-containing protein [Janthinobacterium lividum]